MAKKTETKIEIIPAEQGSLEDVLGPTSEAIVRIAREAEAQGDYDTFVMLTPEEMSEDARTESEQLNPNLVAGGVTSTQVAVIPAVDRQIDAVQPRSPVDVRVGIGGGCHVKNPA